MGKEENLIIRREFVQLLISSGILPSDKVFEAIDQLLDKNLIAQAKKYISDNQVSDEEAFCSAVESMLIQDHRLDQSLGGTYGAPKQIVLLEDYLAESRKLEVKDFVSHFRKRYDAIQGLLMGRQELQGLTSISRISQSANQQNSAFVGIIMDIQETKNKNILITFEDPTGQVLALVSKNRPDLIAQAKSLVHDDIVGITGTLREDLFLIDGVLLPDVPHTKDFKKSPKEGYAVFLSDIHVGSNNFLEDKFMRFIKWLNGQIGTQEQREMVKKIKYLFIIGDLVDGVGVYPGQEDELTITDVKDQYKRSAELLSMIPKNIRIVVGPGNHDAMRLAEPQPRITKEYAQPLYDVPNVTLVPNPAYITIEKTEEFDGFDILMYHGYSFDYFVASVDSIRNAGGYDRADLIMKFLLQRRHLAPTHESTVYVPHASADPLVISKIPDFFVSGHIHKSSVANYRGITMICGSCWQAKTAFQERVGHNPEPARVPVVDLKTRKVKILRF